MSLRVMWLLLAVVLIGANTPIATTAPVVATGQLLAYQDGFVFFTTGDGFRVAPNVAILSDATKQPTSERPAPRVYARAVFNASGVVTELDLSKAPLPVGPMPADVQHFAVAASTPYPNPELALPPQTTAYSPMYRSFNGKPVLVTITVQVPPNTPPGSQIFITTDTSGWNPQAIAMDRIDALHFRVTRRINSGTIMHYLYTRGSLQNEERAENGLERKPRELIVGNADVRAVSDIVYAWADQTTNGLQVQPDVMPTPYNPAPFPNLPPGMPTPHP
jgi:hypothetical protein